MDFARLTERAKEIRKYYELFGEKHYGRQWSFEISLGFMRDVGDLAKLVLAHEGVRTIPEYQEKLEHELADCLRPLRLIADKCEINLERSLR